MTKLFGGLASDVLTAEVGAHGTAAAMCTAGSPPPHDTEFHISKDARATDTIFLVEDDGIFRGCISDLLTRRGYRVLEAANGAEALALWDEHKFEIDCLITDVEMPGKSGPDLARQIIADRPAVAVLIMSAGDSGPARGFQFIQKPFDFTEFLRVIAELIARSQRKPPTSESGDKTGDAQKEA